MTFRDLQREVLDPDLCTRCGACVAVCPPAAIELTGEQLLPEFNRTGGAGPQDVCGECSLCLAVCPGRDTGAGPSELRQFGRRRGPDERWSGIGREVVEVASTDEQVLAQASAGGAATSLLLAALRAGVIDAALVVQADEQQPWRSRAVLTASEEVVIRSAAAKYTFAPNLPLLADTPYRRIGMVGLPCQIQAVNKMWNLDAVPAAGRRVALTVELACASATLPAGTRWVLEHRLGVEPGEVASMRYRGGPYPGDLTVRTRDGREHRYPFHAMVKDFVHFKTFRCDACPDWWSGLADLSIADGDPNIFATSQRGAHGRPRSAVAVRTELGAQVLAEAGHRGLVTVTPAEFDPAESLGLQRKRHRYNRIAARSARPVPSPPTEDLDTEAWKSDEDVIADMSGRG